MQNGSSKEYYGWTVLDSDEGPSTKMPKTTWIESCFGDNSKIDIKMNAKITSESFVEEFSKNFAKKTSWNSKGVRLLNDPFQVGVIENFLADKSLTQKLVDEMQTLEWTRKQMDLYEFYQTTDLANVTSPYLNSFYNFINTNMRNWMEKLTGMKFQKISASCSMYNCGDFLLSHDDLLTDRLIAFVFYISPWDGVNKWNESMGGALELFSSDADGQPKFPVAQKIPPANNQLSFFKVEKSSHHQVGEVLTKEYPRLTINGWFHGYKDNPHYDSDAVRVKKPNLLKFKKPNDEEFNFDEIINTDYLKEEVKKSIQIQIEENSEASLIEFFKRPFLADLTTELKKCQWTLKGPANQQNFEILNINSLNGSSKVLKLLNLLASKQFFNLLYEYTELDFNENAKNKPTCRVEMQKWKGGCYTLIGDPSTYQDDTLDLIFYIGNNDNIAVVNYLTPEGKKDSESVISEEEDDSVLLTVYPQNNSLNLVYRNSGTAHFTKYCYKSTVMNDYCNYVLFCSYKE